jgi:hypothetical protein
MILLLLALVVLAVPVYGVIRWVLIAGRTASQAEAVAAFLQFLPEALRDPQKVTLICIVCAVAAVFLALMALRTLAAIVRVVAYLVMGVAGLLVAWNLFTLM